MFLSTVCETHTVINQWTPRTPTWLRKERLCQKDYQIWSWILFLKDMDTCPPTTPSPPLPGHPPGGLGLGQSSIQGLHHLQERVLTAPRHPKEWVNIISFICSSESHCPKPDLELLAVWLFYSSLQTDKLEYGVRDATPDPLGVAGILAF